MIKTKQLILVQTLNLLTVSTFEVLAFNSDVGKGNYQENRFCIL